MLSQIKKTRTGGVKIKLKNNIKRNTSLLTYNTGHLMNNSQIELIKSNPSIEEEGSNSYNYEGASGIPQVDLSTKLFKFTTQNSGHPRAVKVIEIKIGDKIIKITDIFTMLPKDLNDAMASMVQTHQLVTPEVNFYQITNANREESEKIEGQANIIGISEEIQNPENEEKLLEQDKLLQIPQDLEKNHILEASEEVNLSKTAPFREIMEDGTIRTNSQKKINRKNLDSVEKSEDDEERSKFSSISGVLKKPIEKLKTVVK